MQFKTQFNTKPSPPELGGGEKLVETAGYIPAHKQIENLLMAGKRLMSYREQYDFTGDDKIDEDFSDPTRSGNFDLADATQINLQMEAKARAAAVPGDIPSPSTVDDKTEPEHA